jgi:hypothetical protein
VATENAPRVIDRALRIDEGATEVQRLIIGRDSLAATP